MKKITASISIFFLLMICDHATGQADSFDYGKIEKNTYTNSFFKLSMPLPSDWSIQTKEQIEELGKVGKEAIVGDDANMKRIYKASEVNSANLLTSFKYEVGSPVDYNPGFALVIENIKTFPGIKSGKDYLFNVRRILQQAQVKYDEIDENFKSQTIGGKEFHIMEATLNLMDRKIYQMYYSSVINGFAFNFVVSYADPVQKTELIGIINGMKFKK